MHWYGADDPRCYYGGRESIDYYHRQLRERRRRYPRDWVDQYPEVADALEEKGYCVLRQVFDPGALYRLRAEAEAALQDPRLLKKNDANMQMIGHPLLNLPSAVGIAFDDLLANIAASWMVLVFLGFGIIGLRQFIERYEHLDAEKRDERLWRILLPGGRPDQQRQATG